MVIIYVCGSRFLGKHKEEDYGQLNQHFLMNYEKFVCFNPLMPKEEGPTGSQTRFSTNLRTNNDIFVVPLARRFHYSSFKPEVQLVFLIGPDLVQDR